MTNSDSTELHHNQEKAVYEKLPSDENEKPAKQNLLKLDVEIKLNDDLKESSTDVDLNKQDNPIVANGGNHGSKSSLDKTEGGGATVAGKKIDDEDEDEQSGTGTSDQDTFMFGMSKLRTFFFFLSLALLVAFVLVFVFVLPCSQTAEMEERTTKLTDKASPGSASKLGDMDGDGKDDVAFFTPSSKPTDENSSKKKRREAEDANESICIVDGASQPCVGEIAVVSASVGTPIGVRSIGVEPELSSDGSTIKCVSGGSRQKMACLITSNGGKVYVVDMKASINSNAKSNMTMFPSDGCEGQKILPISVTKESEIYGFFYSCNNGQASFVEAPSMTKHSVTISPVIKDKIFDQRAIHHQTKVATLYANGTEYLSLTTSQPGRKAGESVIGMDTVGHFDFPVAPEGDWHLVSASVGFLMFSDHNLVVPHEMKETSNTIAFPNNKITSVAKDRDVKYTLVQLCDDTTCLYHMYDVTALTPEEDNAPFVQSASVSKFHLTGSMPVQYVVGASYNYFVAWHFKEVKEEETTVTEESETNEEKEKTESNEVKSDKKRRETEQDCDTKIEAQMLGFSATSFKKPALLYKNILCPGPQMKFVMLSGQHTDQPTYSFAIDGEQTSSVFGILLPENSFVNKQGITTEGWIDEQM